MIRPMTNDEIKRALRHGAQVCIEDQKGGWHHTDVLPSDGSYEAAEDFLQKGEGFCATSAHAATFLLLVAEAVE